MYGNHLSQLLTLSQDDSLIPQGNQQIPLIQIPPTDQTTTIQPVEEVQLSSNHYDFGMPTNRGVAVSDFWFPIGNGVYGNHLSPTLFASENNSSNNNNNYYYNNNNNNPSAKKHSLYQMDSSYDEAKTKQHRPNDRRGQEEAKSAKVIDCSNKYYWY